MNLAFIYFGPYSWILIPGILLMLYAQYKVTSTFNKYSRVGSKANITGAEVARILIQARGLDVPIERSGGRLSDHYDPRKKVVRLSPGVHDSTSVAAIGVAAHETGHALQDADGYRALVARNGFYPVAGFASQAMMPLLLLSFFTGFRMPWVLYALIACFGIYALFALITLPVEFNASSRALKLLGNTGILAEDETPKARAVLSAAALTYVASAVYAVLNLISIFLLARDD
jgi:Zn-dependent membrane protease YugP